MLKPAHINKIISESVTTTNYLISEINLATMIVYSDALDDTSSDEYRIASEDVMILFQRAFKDIAGSANITFESQSISFVKSDVVQLGKPGQLAYSRTDTIIIAVYSKNGSSTDLDELADTVWILTSSYFTNAMSNSAGTVISTSAVPSVSISVEDSFTPDDTEYESTEYESTENESTETTGTSNKFVRFCKLNKKKFRTRLKTVKK